MLPSSRRRSELGFQSDSEYLLLHGSVFRSADDCKGGDDGDIWIVCCFDRVFLPFYYWNFDVARQGDSTQGWGSGLEQGLGYTWRAFIYRGLVF